MKNQSLENGNQPCYPLWSFFLQTVKSCSTSPNAIYITATVALWVFEFPRLRRTDSWCKRTHYARKLWLAALYRRRSFQDNNNSKVLNNTVVRWIIPVENEAFRMDHVEQLGHLVPKLVLSIDFVVYKHQRFTFWGLQRLLAIDGPPKHLLKNKFFQIDFPIW